MFRLPSPLHIKQIRPSIFRAPESIIQESAVPGFIQRVALIPHPVPIKHVAPTINLPQKIILFPTHNIAPINLQPQKPLVLRRKSHPFRHTSVIQQKKAKNHANRQAQHPNRGLKETKPLHSLVEIHEFHGVGDFRRWGIAHLDILKSRLDFYLIALRGFSGKVWLNREGKWSNE